MIMLWGRLFECRALRRSPYGSENASKVQAFILYTDLSRLAAFPSSTETAIKRKGRMDCQFSKLALMEFNSVMLSSELTDQKQIKNKESFFANAENGAIFP